jgi:hypothetical protein
VVPLNTLFTITFDDMGGYLYQPPTGDGINYSNRGGVSCPVLYSSSNPLGYNSFQSWLTAAKATNAAFNYTCPNWFAFQPGLVAWVVPNSGQYKISAAGGSGAYSYNSVLAGARNAGGRGRLITATYYLMIGDVLIMSIGSRGYGGGPSNTSANAHLGFGGGGGFTVVMRNGLLKDDNSITLNQPGFPLILAAGGSGGSTVFAGVDASSSDLTGTNPTVGNTLVGPTGGGTLNAGTCWLTAPGGRDAPLFGFSGDILRDSLYSVGAGGVIGGGWGGGGRGSTTISGGGAGWNGALGSSATVACGQATSYYWSGSGYIASSYVGGYNSAVVSGSGTTGGGYVTIQQL